MRSISSKGGVVPPSEGLGECRSPAPERREGGRRHKHGEAVRFRPPAPGKTLMKIKVFFYILCGIEPERARARRSQANRTPHSALCK